MDVIQRIQQEYSKKFPKRKIEFINEINSRLLFSVSWLSQGQKTTKIFSFDQTGSDRRSLDEYIETKNIIESLQSKCNQNDRWNPANGQYHFYKSKLEKWSEFEGI